MGLIDRATKKAAPHLAPGEQVVTAAGCMMKGTMAAGAIGGAAGMLIASRRGKSKREEAAASGFPLAQSMLLVVTDQRVLVFSGRKLLGPVAGADLTGAEVVKKNAISPWTVRVGLANGNDVMLEVKRQTGPDRFVEAMNRLAAA